MVFNKINWLKTCGEVSKVSKNKSFRRKWTSLFCLTYRPVQTCRPNMHGQPSAVCNASKISEMLCLNLVSLLKQERSNNTVFFQENVYFLNFRKEIEFTIVTCTELFPRTFKTIRKFYSVQQRKISSSATLRLTLCFVNY